MLVRDALDSQDGSGILQLQYRIGVAFFRADIIVYKSKLQGRSPELEGENVFNASESGKRLQILDIVE